MRLAPVEIAILLGGISVVTAVHGADPPQPIAQDWDYAEAMREVARQSTAREGVVIHVGDSITHANPYGQWARHGAGRTEEDLAALERMHCGADDETDGWWLCRFDHPDGGRSHTAAGRMTADELLAGGRQGLPSLTEMLRTYRPQIVVLMIGTNDVSAGRELDDYRRDVSAALDAILAAGATPILSTIPPHIGRVELSAQYNEALRELARDRKLPLIDYEREILARRPDDWNGTLLNQGDVHPTAQVGEVTAASAPTEENLRSSGYLLRGWLSVQKIKEVKRAVLDGALGAGLPTPPRQRP